MGKIGQAALWSPEEAGVLDYLPSKDKDCQSPNLQTKIQPPFFRHSSVLSNNLSRDGQKKKKKCRSDPISARTAAGLPAKASGDGGDGDGDPLILTRDNDAKLFSFLG